MANIPNWNTYSRRFNRFEASKRKSRRLYQPVPLQAWFEQGEMIETFMLLGVITFLVCIVVKRPKNYPLGPTLFPLAGVYPLLDNEYPMKSWTALREKYGDFVGMVMGNRHGVLVSNWDAVKEVLNHEDCQGRPDVCLIRDRFNGENYGIAFTDGPHWKVQRRFTLHHFRNLGFGRQMHESVLEDEALALVQHIADQKGEPISVLNRIAISVINTTWSLMGGCRYSYDDPIMLKLAKHIDESLHDIQINGSIAVAIPFLRYIFPNATGYTSLMSGTKGVREFIKMVIAEHKNNFDPDKPKDFIDIYLTELANSKKVVDPSFSEIQLEGLCMDLLSAGTDTTSSAITFAIMFLALNNDVQDKIHKEMDDGLGKDRFPSISDRPNLIYTDATFMEVLRMRAPLPIMIPHRVTKDTRVYGYDLPVDTYMLVNVYSVHMDKDYWGDPEILRPERFVTEEGKLRKDERLIPFGKGKRSCLGETLARIMAFLFFALLAQNFKFTIAPESEVKDTKGSHGFTLAPPEFKVIATPRNQC